MEPHSPEPSPAGSCATDAEPVESASRRSEIAEAARAPAPPAVRPHHSAIVLAAGLSRRMGAKNKLLLRTGGAPMIRRVVERVLATGFVEVVVVLGHEASEVALALSGLEVRTVHNAEFASGQVSSVRVGLRALTLPVDAVMICLGDQPLVTTPDLAAELAAYAERPHGSILVPFRGEQRGNPVILDWNSARETLERGTHFGCRRFMDQHPELVYRWPAPNDHYVRDVDEPADYEALVEAAGA